MSGKVLITGATGFVGRHLSRHLLADGWKLRGAMLPFENGDVLPPEVETAVVEPLGPDTVWETALSDIDTVIHLAARVHMMDDPSRNPLIEYRKVNTAGTLQLATEAARLGVKRFVYISTIKVNGEESPVAYTEIAETNPTDPYAISKFEAEQALRALEKKTGLQVVIIRPPLVYGPEVKANFLTLLKVIQQGWPLPFASIDNKRSFIYIGNFVDAIKCCSVHPLASGHTFLVSDGEDVSTPELISRIASSMRIKSHLLPFPVKAMQILLNLVGKNALFDRLAGSLTIDCAKIHDRLGWVPPFTVDQGLAATSKWFLDHVGA